MRPQDVPILLKILSCDASGMQWQMKDLAGGLGISPSEVSESLNRSHLAGLIDLRKTKVNRHALLEFLQKGISYVFPQQPGPIVRGVKTAHSASPLNKKISSDDSYVWAYPEGNERGQAIEPLYPTLVKAALQDPYLYQALGLVDALRVGRVREKEIAAKELEKLIL
jgi:DNA-binding Lrp family transcriptional regulator